MDVSLVSEGFFVYHTPKKDISRKASMISLKSRQSSRVGHTQMVRIWWLLLSLAVAVIAVPGMSSAENAESVGVKNRATQAFKAGRFDEAAKLFEEAFDLNPLGNLLYNIAFCYEKSGNKTAAIKFYKRFLDAVPGAPQKTELLERISRLARTLDSRYRQVKVVTEPAGAYILLRIGQTVPLDRRPSIYHSCRVSIN